MTDIKKKWQDLQSFVKKKESQRRKSVRQTGGGPMQISSLKPWEEKILQTIPQTSICGIEDGVDTSSTCTSSNMSQGTSTQVHVSQGGQDRYVEAVPSVIITEDSPVSTGTDSSLLSQEESCLLTAPSPRHSRGTASSRNSGNVLSGNVCKTEEIHRVKMPK
ncbi:uncharacterized protein LOC133183285 isoform X2 [Saccostrea echinata]|uniref:uncharacterized protein LOC133183285 isoform X2 n=1 Tax=Saccostrea echinata TaxID=191078 RepID=UPI002A7ED6FB|nr:uncharacterized protein LOC133183285 isoform X2 [Saccostrea echinata]